MALGTACPATSSELQHLGIRARCGDQRPFTTATHPYQELYQTGSPLEPVVSTQGDASAGRLWGPPPTGTTVPRAPPGAVRAPLIVS